MKQQDIAFFYVSELVDIILAGIELNLKDMPGRLNELTGLDEADVQLENARLML